MYPHRLYAISKRKRVVYRNKLIVLAVTMMMIASCSMFLGSKLVRAQESSNIDTKAYYKSIEISKGETLWEIAEHYRDQETQSIKEYIREIKQLNNLSTDMIQEGTCLTVVYYSSPQLASR